MGARAIGRSRSVDDREALRIPQRLERRERRMQAEETIEIDGRFRRAALPRRFRNGKRRAQVVVRAFAVGYDHVETVDRAALKDRDQGLTASARRALRHSLRQRNTLKK